MADGWSDECDAVPAEGDVVTVLCKQCGHLVMVHGAMGCALCQFGKRLYALERRLEGVIENHHLWDGS